MLKKVVRKISGAIAPALVLFLGMAFPVYAVSLNESTDAGEYLFNAGRTNTQAAGTSLDSIVGTLSPAGDIDLWEIYVPGGTFSASTVGNAATLDTQLFLFNSSGIGIYASNDAAGDPFFKSTISIANLAIGTYYIGISSYGSDPQSAEGLIFNFNAGDPATSANGPGGASPLNSWSANPVSEAGNYGITLTNAQFVGPTAAVPYEFNPTSGLLILGIWGVWKWKKRQKN